MPHRAIETKFSGCDFRSRAEARWAAFFDALRIEWQYEPEGFQLSKNRRYLPDFELPGVWCHGEGVYLEVKGKAPTEAETRRCLDLANLTDQTVVLAIRAPLPPDVLGGTDNDSMHVHFPKNKARDEYRDTGYGFAECDSCGRIGITYAGYVIPGDFCECERDDSVPPQKETPRLLAAYVAARAHRFGT